jgi:hypothetical protein
VNLDQIQRAMFHAVRQPLTPSEGMRERALDGASLRETANQIIRPNDRLSSFERLEIYNRQYWFRIISSMCDDFEGLRHLLGEKQFHKLVIAYLIEHPSSSFTLRNLGAKLESWLGAHLEYLSGVEAFALDFVRLEWTEIDVFDSAALPPVSAADLLRMGHDPLLRLQPYIRLLELSAPVHDLLLKIRERSRERVKNGEDENAPVRKLSARSLPKPRKTYLAVHRLDDSVYFKDLEPAAFAMLKAFQGECAVSEAIEAPEWSGRSEEEVGTAVRDYFSNWASLGWFCKVTGSGSRS